MRALAYTLSGAFTRAAETAEQDSFVRRTGEPACIVLRRRPELGHVELVERWRGFRGTRIGCNSRLTAGFRSRGNP